MSTLISNKGWTEAGCRGEYYREESELCADLSVDMSVVGFWASYKMFVFVVCIADTDALS